MDYQKSVFLKLFQNTTQLIWNHRYLPRVLIDNYSRKFTNG